MKPRRLSRVLRPSYGPMPLVGNHRYLDDHAYERKGAPVVPSATEIAALPRPARVLFGARNAARVELLPGADVPPLPAGCAAPDVLHQHARAVYVALALAATSGTVFQTRLLSIRQDFVDLVDMTAQLHWTDESAVPDDAIGPLWPMDPPPWYPDPERAPDARPAPRG